MDQLQCVICRESLDNGTPTVKVQQKGSDGINAASKERGDFTAIPGQTVHNECRRKYCNVNETERFKRENIKSQLFPRALRSKCEFVFKEHCMFCGQTAKISGKKRGLMFS